MLLSRKTLPWPRAGKLETTAPVDSTSRLPPIIAWNSSRPVVNWISSRSRPRLVHSARLLAEPDLAVDRRRVQVADAQLGARLRADRSKLADAAIAVGRRRPERRVLRRRVMSLQFHACSSWLAVSTAGPGRPPRLLAVTATLPRLRLVLFHHQVADVGAQLGEAWLLVHRLVARIGERHVDDRRAPAPAAPSRRRSATTGRSPRRPSG